MNEIKIQPCVRRENEFGGALLYIVVPVLLLGVVAAAGFYTGMLDKSLLDKIPFFGKGISSATATIEDVTDTIDINALTVGEIIGDPDTEMPDVLNNIMKVRESQQRTRAELEKKMKELQDMEALVDQKTSELAKLTKQATDSIQVLLDLQRQREERDKSELSQMEDDLAKALASAKVKEVAKTLVSLYQSTAEKDAKIKERNKLLVLRLMHRYTGRALSQLLTELSKSNPAAAAQIYADFATKTNDELYGIKPKVTSATNTITSPTSAAPPLSPPVLGGTGASQPAGQ